MKTMGLLILISSLTAAVTASAEPSTNLHDCAYDVVTPYLADAMMEGQMQSRWAEELSIQAAREACIHGQNLGDDSLDPNGNTQIIKTAIDDAQKALLAKTLAR